MNLRAALFLGAMSAAAGCASIVSGSTQEVSFTSNPEGATVTTDGTTLGVTPLTFPLKKSKYTSVTFRKDGYKPLTLPMNSRLDGWFWGNIVFGGFIGSTTDGLSGAAKEYSPGQYMISLEPLTATRIENDTLKSEQQKAREFIVMGYRNIMSELSKGAGDYFHSLMEVLKISPEDRAAATKKLRALADAYANIPEFADRAIEMFLPERATTNTPAAPSLDWETVKFGAPKDQYQHLVGLNREDAQTKVRAMTGKQRTALNEFILETKGQKPAMSWAFPINPGVSPQEREFIKWYLRENTDYKPE